MRLILVVVLAGAALWGCLATMMVQAAPTPEPTLRPTRFPTTRAPTHPDANQCSSGCYLGHLTNGRCDPLCNLPECDYDGGECQNSACNTVPWIRCMNETFHNDYAPKRDLFFNYSLEELPETPQSFFCNTTFNYYRSLANCTETYQCWPLFEDFMWVRGWKFDVLKCDSVEDASDVILSKQCGKRTCNDLLPGHHTHSPTMGTPAPTEYLGPIPQDSTMLGVVLGSTIGGIVAIVLAFACYLCCTASGLKRILADKERRLDEITRDIERLEELDRENHNTFFSNKGIREVQLERLENKREILIHEIASLQKRIEREMRQNGGDIVAPIDDAAKFDNTEGPTDSISTKA